MNKLLTRARLLRALRDPAYRDALSELDRAITNLNYCEQEYKYKGDATRRVERERKYKPDPYLNS